MLARVLRGRSSLESLIMTSVEVVAQNLCTSSPNPAKVQYRYSHTQEVADVTALKDACFCLPASDNMPSRRTVRARTPKPHTIFCVVAWALACAIYFRDSLQAAVTVHVQPHCMCLAKSQSMSMQVRKRARSCMHSFLQMNGCL